MKKILYMTGAVRNAGDFLIEYRTKAILKKFMPETELITENRVSIDYSDRIDYLNSFSAIVFPGGPIYQPQIYPNAIPFVKDLKAICVPVFFIGGGGKTPVYGRKMSEETISFFKLGTNKGVPLGCRDILTYRFLKQQGFSNLLMTGCPAWYNLDYISKFEINHHNNKKKKILFSEPANPLYIPLLIKLCYMIRNGYPDAEMLLVIHREDIKDYEKLLMKLKNDIGLSHVVISGSADGFKIYDDCDMHIGFRVHAHIYNLSIRNFTILINEDIRGIGVNQTLGLENIDIIRPYYKEKKIYKNLYLLYSPKEYYIYDYVVQHVLDYIEEAKNTNFKNYIDAFKRMNYYFGVMQSHVKSIDRVI